MEAIPEIGDKYDRLEFLMKKSDKKIADIADFIGVSQVAYGKWESGKAKPKYNSTLKLLELYKNDFPPIITPDTSQITKTTGRSIRKNHDSAELIPFYDIDFVAGNSVSFIDDTAITPE